jgi:hypothetical protein
MVRKNQLSTFVDVSMLVCVLLLLLLFSGTTVYRMCYNISSPIFASNLRYVAMWTLGLILVFSKGEEIWLNVKDFHRQRRRTIERYEWNRLFEEHRQANC